MNKTNNSSLVIVLPCYNCGKAVIDVVEGILPFTNRILAMNDGSTDDTVPTLESLPVHIQGWEKNRGKGVALLEGFRHWLQESDWDYCITIDSDGQHNPAEIAGFLNEAEKTQAGIVVGTRSFGGSTVPAHRRIANTLSSSLIASLTGCPVRDIQCGYRLLHRSAIEALLPELHEDAYAMETEMLMKALRLGIRVGETEVECIYNTESSIRSAWRPLTDSFKIARVVAKHMLSR